MSSKAIHSASVTANENSGTGGFLHVICIIRYLGFYRIHVKKIGWMGGAKVVKVDRAADTLVIRITPICDPKKVEGCATALRSDKRPWCSLDKIFTGNFIFCDEDEAIKLKRVNELKAEELYNTAASGLMENLKPEKYDLYKVMLDQEFYSMFFYGLEKKLKFLKLESVMNILERQLN